MENNTIMNKTTEPKAKPTAGPTSVYVGFEDVTSVRQNGSLLEICIVNTRRPKEQREADANLINDAFNVHHETALTPRQLVEQNGKQKKQIRDLVLWAEDLTGRLRDPSLNDRLDIDTRDSVTMLIAAIKATE